MGGGSRLVLILMIQGGGVQNWPKVNDVIYGCSLISRHLIGRMSRISRHVWLGGLCQRTMSERVGGEDEGPSRGSFS